MPKAQRGRGRPPLGDAARAATVMVRFRPDELAAVESAVATENAEWVAAGYADAPATTVASWIRERVLDAIGIATFAEITGLTEAKRRDAIACCQERLNGPRTGPLPVPGTLHPGLRLAFDAYKKVAADRGTLVGGAAEQRSIWAEAIRLLETAVAA